MVLVLKSMLRKLQLQDQPQLVLGMLAIFTYVGVEVAVGSNLGELLKLDEFGGLQSSEIAPYISMYWGSLMIGRWAALLAYLI